MKLETALKAIKGLKALGGEAAVAIAIHDELVEYGERFEAYGWPEALGKTSDKQLVILGLGFSEFLTGGDCSDTGYVVAAAKKDMLLKAAGLDGAVLLKELQKLSI